VIKQVRSVIVLLSITIRHTAESEMEERACLFLLRKQTPPYRFREIEFGYFNQRPKTLLILKRCSCPLIPKLPDRKVARVAIEKFKHVDLW